LLISVSLPQRSATLGRLWSSGLVDGYRDCRIQCDDSGITIRSYFEEAVRAGAGLGPG